MKKVFYKWAVAGCGLTVGVVGAAILFVATVHVFPQTVEPIYQHVQAVLNPEGLEKSKLSQLDYKNIKELIDKGALLSLNDILADTMSYYSTIISVLVAVIVLMGAIAFMYIRGVSKESAIQEAKDYFQSREFEHRVTDHIEDLVLERVNAKTSDLTQELEKKLARITSLENKVNKFDESIEIGKLAGNEKLQLPEESVPQTSTPQQGT